MHGDLSEATRRQCKQHTCLKLIFINRSMVSIELHKHALLDYLMTELENRIILHKDTLNGHVKTHWQLLIVFSV